MRPNYKALAMYYRRRFLEEGRAAASFEFRCKMADEENKKCWEEIMRLRDRLAQTEAEVWISVDDRLPEDGEWVLVSMISKVTGKRRRIKCGIRNAGVWAGDWPEGCAHASEITHWMPTPEPPLEGGHQ